MRKSIKLKSVVLSPNVKILDTDQGVFIADVEKHKIFDIGDDVNLDESSDIIYNQSNMLDVTRGVMLQNYYDISEFDGQSFRSPLSRDKWTNTSSDYVEQYNAGDLPYNSVTQFGTFGFILSDETIDGLRDESFSYNNDEYEQITSPVNLYVYPPSGEIVLCGFPEDGEVEYNDSDLYGTMVPLYNLSGVAYNYMGEVDCGKSYFDFMNPTFYANHTNTKTHLNIDYDTGSMVTSSVDVSSVSATLSNTRVYNKIDSSTDLLYMTYKYNRDYISESLSTHISDDRIFDDYSLDTLSSSHITNINMSGYSTVLPDTIMVSSLTGGPTLSAVSAYITGSVPNTGWAYTPTGWIEPEPPTGAMWEEQPYIPMNGDEFANKFDYIETIGVNTLGGLGKYDTQSVHKTNVYSINIQNANIDSSTELSSGNELEHMKTSISNIIKNMVESSTPVNTQLIDINWNGE